MDALASFQKASRKLEKLPVPQHHTIFILATPSFASWVEASTDFIPQALKCAFGDLASVEVDVVCAVCDGLAPRPVSMTHPTGEGFSILHQPGEELGLWEDDDASATSPNLQSTLTFVPYPGSGTSIVVPLANTLFKNGRHSTLLLSRWKSEGGSFELMREQKERQNVPVPFLWERQNRRLRFHMSCIPLTPVRRIQSGLGNIVRSIDFGEGSIPDIGPASRELETSVDNYLAKEGHDHSKIDVWALVVPKDIYLDPRDQVEEISTNDINTPRAVASPSSHVGGRYVGRRLKRGAKLCRVLSGGGGWGAKQGLLSLDPQTSYSTSNESRYDLSEGSLDKKQASALGNLAQEGAFIQFLVAVKNEKPDTSEASERDSFAPVRSTVVGVVPSTIDHIYDEQQEKLAFGCDVSLGHFGCVSESGIFLRFIRDEKTGVAEWGFHALETKIDLPYSYAYSVSKVSKKSSSKLNEEVRNQGD